MTMGAAEADEILAARFAPWALEPGLTVQAVGEDRAAPRPPWSDRLAREGGGLSGQALTAAADTATVIAVSAARVGFAPMTTVHVPAGGDRCGRPGRSGADEAGPADGVRGRHIERNPLAARASTVYAILD
ncbi:hypothetical protein ACE1SV_58810 [Streptomyces sp. E-15]